MAPRKRARTSSTGGSSSSSAAAPTITLTGGEPYPAKFVALWRSGRFTDTVVTVEDRSFVADRKVLASESAYFERHYDHEHMRNADHPKLLEHVTAAAFEPLLTFLYEGACTFDESLLAPVLKAAHYLGVAPLERAAVAAFKQRLSPSNALTAWTWGEELELPELAEAAKETALQSFDDVEKIEEATLAQVQALVADDRLTARSEEVVFSAVARFAEAKHPSEADLLALLRNVRFTLMSRAFIHETVRTSPLLQTAAGKDLIIEMMVPLVNGPAQQPRQGFGSRFLYVMGGSSVPVGIDHATEFRLLSTVEIYDTQTNTWAAGTPPPTPRMYAAAAVLDGKIYVTANRPVRTHPDYDELFDAVQVYDPQTNTWAHSPPMRTPRRCHAHAVVGGKLYAIGGDDSEGRDLSSVEAFDPQTGAWIQVAPMSECRYQAAAAVLDGKIYVTGGSEDWARYLDSVEVYDPLSNTWALAPPMPTKRRQHGAAVLGGKLYVAGGDGSGAISVEAFDPQTSRWVAVAPMSTARSFLSLTAAQGKLYAVGGMGDSNTVLATVEAYDPRQDRWEAVAPMTAARCSAAALCMS